MVVASISPSRKVGRPAGVRVDAVLVKRCRERLGLSREALAELAGVTARTLQRVENEGLAGLPLLKQLCEVLRLPMPALLKAEPEVVRESLRAHGLGPAAPPTLVGRDAERAALRAHFEALMPRGIAVIAGPPGVGATALAQQVVDDVAARYPDGVVWIRGGALDVRRAQREIAVALGFDAHLPSRDDGGRDWTQAFTTWLWQGRRLVVLDGVERASAVRELIAPDTRGALLVTTPSAHLAAELGVEATVLEPLDDRATRAMIGAPAAASAARLEELLALVGGIPALAVAAKTALARAQRTIIASDLALARAQLEVAAAARALYERRLERLSAAAMVLFTRLGDAPGGAMGVAELATATGLDEPQIWHGASELVDHHLVEHSDDRHGATLSLSAPAVTAARAIALDDDASGAGASTFAPR